MDSEHGLRQLPSPTKPHSSKAVATREWFARMRCSQTIIRVTPHDLTVDSPLIICRYWFYLLLVHINLNFRRNGRRLSFVPPPHTMATVL